MSNESTALAHAEALKATIEGAGHAVTRCMATDEGFAFQLLIAPSELPADLVAIAMLVTGAGYAIAKDWQPAWLPLRKCVVVTCANPDAT